MAGYEGWKSYETWSVNLNLSNDEKTYRHWSKAAQDAIDNASGRGGARAAVTALAARMEEELTRFIEGSAFKSLPEHAQNLLIMDMREVDWKEIASHWIDLES